MMKIASAASLVTLAILTGCASQEVREPGWRAAEVVVYQGQNVIDRRRFDQDAGDKAMSLTASLPADVTDQLSEAGGQIDVSVTRQSISAGGMREFTYTIARSSSQLSAATSGLARVLEGEAFEASIPGVIGGRVRVRIIEEPMLTSAEEEVPKTDMVHPSRKTGPRTK